jgi:calcineurin-like phosphoesterase family protein
MTKVYTEYWNSVVDPGDTVYVIGDLAFGGREPVAKMIRKLNGNIVLIMGNHDRYKPAYYLRAGVKSVFQNGHTMVLDNGSIVGLSHYPYRPSFLRQLWLRLTGHPAVKAFDRMPINVERILLHGHTHKGPVVRGNMINVGIDLHGKLLSEQDVIDIIRSEVNK